MAPQRPEKTQKRPRNRKARTEVSSDSSSSSSDSGSEMDSPPASQNMEKKQKQKHSVTTPAQVSSPAASASPSAEHSTSPSPLPVSAEQGPPGQQLQQDAKQSFEQFYLTQATREFANDLEKLRHAGDWRGERSLGVLVRGLRQGVGCFEGDGVGRS